MFHVIIPARYESSRLPGKPLSMIGDKAMILHVCDKAAKSSAASITVATDNETICKLVRSSGYQAVMTDPSHPSGSDRVFQAAELIGLNDDDVIVNVQGDEPFIPCENINLVASLINEQQAMSTLCCNIDKVEDVLNPNVVKVIKNKVNQAVYFSRSVIPYRRENPLSLESTIQKGEFFRHIGIYAYTKDFLSRFIQWPQSFLEKMESLEQLRVLEQGEKIAIACLEQAPPSGVDTPEDLANAQAYFLSIK
ncbi:MAG: 3-deoxy-manno-octulosonate cytidylyltransferase [Gammaproteobacteria bacterium]|nr:3-deoxy-manno-octulosonate cytidylyltransferase [Gammaproteobacteria bacterium]MDH5629313.1 3-deoxy-manno-octulosonate cytidylyltransferase [Gammaproteobacteria bacterium]